MPIVASPMYDGKRTEIIAVPLSRFESYLARKHSREGVSSGNTGTYVIEECKARHGMAQTKLLMEELGTAMCELSPQLGGLHHLLAGSPASVPALSEARLRGCVEIFSNHKSMPALCTCSAKRLVFLVGTDWDTELLNIPLRSLVVETQPDEQTVLSVCARGAGGACIKVSVSNTQALGRWLTCFEERRVVIVGVIQAVPTARSRLNLVGRLPTVEWI